MPHFGGPARRLAPWWEPPVSTGGAGLQSRAIFAFIFAVADVAAPFHGGAFDFCAIGHEAPPHADRHITLVQRRRSRPGAFDREGTPSVSRMPCRNATYLSPAGCRTPLRFLGKGAGFAFVGAKDPHASSEKYSGRNLETFAQFLDVGLVEDAFLVQNFGHDTFGPKD